VLVLGAIIGAETVMPIDWKPSVLLLQSTGDLPPRLEQTLLDELDRSRRMKTEADQMREHAADLAASIARIEDAQEALNGRIQQKMIDFNQYRP
jgi:hypothetical protein